MLHMAFSCSTRLVGLRDAPYDRDMNKIFVLFLGLVGMAACTHHVKIEPSDKPFVVNLNVKIDHEVKLQIQEKNQDLLNLEDQVLSTKKPKKEKT